MTVGRSGRWMSVGVADAVAVGSGGGGVDVCVSGDSDVDDDSVDEAAAASSAKRLLVAIWCSVLYFFPLSILMLTKEEGVKLG